MNAERYYDRYLVNILWELNHVASCFGGLLLGTHPKTAPECLAYGKYKIGKKTWKCLLKLHRDIKADHKMQKKTTTAIPYKFNFIEDVLFEIESTINFEKQTQGTSKTHNFEIDKLAEIAEHYKKYLSMRARDENYAAHQILYEYISNYASAGTPSYRLFQKGLNEGLGCLLGHNGMRVNIASH